MPRVLRSEMDAMWPRRDNFVQQRMDSIPRLSPWVESILPVQSSLAWSKCAYQRKLRRDPPQDFAEARRIGEFSASFVVPVVMAGTERGLGPLGEAPVDYGRDSNFPHAPRASGIAGRDAPWPLRSYASSARPGGNRGKRICARDLAAWCQRGDSRPLRARPLPLAL